jgi:thioredoxin reductase
MLIVTSTISATYSTRRGIKYITVWGNEFAGNDENQFLKIGKTVELIAETDNIKPVKQWLKRVKNSANVIEIG